MSNIKFTEGGNADNTEAPMIQREAESKLQPEPKEDAEAGKITIEETPPVNLPKIPETPSETPPKTEIKTKRKRGRPKKTDIEETEPVSDEEWGLIYGSGIDLMAMGLWNVSVQINDERAEAQGKRLGYLARLYGFDQFKYASLILFFAGFSIDMKYAHTQAQKTKKPKSEKQSKPDDVKDKAIYGE